MKGYSSSIGRRLKILLIFALAQCANTFQNLNALPGQLGKSHFLPKCSRAYSNPTNRNIRVNPLSVKMFEIQIESNSRTPRLPSSWSTDSDTRKRIAKIMEKSTVFDLLYRQVTDAVTDIGLHVGRDVDEAMKRYSAKRRKERLPVTKSETLNRKPRVVVLGSGWGAHALVKIIDTDKFDVVAVSPRPYFIFTPMLASSSVGTVEYRSITEAMRESNPFVDYLQAAATCIDVQSKQVHCRSVVSSGPAGTLMGTQLMGTQLMGTMMTNGDTFSLSYDYLVVSIGMQTATFGTPGVQEYCNFLRDVDDARKLRNRIVNQFEAASLPSLTDAQRIALLTFVVVGGGPTGVEFSGELFDFLRQDIEKYYPKLVPFVRTKLLQSGGSVLETFDATMQKMALDSLEKSGLDLVLKARVKEVTKNKIFYTQAGQEVVIDYGLCVWACGNGPVPIAKDLIKMQGETESSKLGRIEVDPWMRMVGVNDGSVFAVGDCAASELGPLPQTAQVAGQQGAFVARLLNKEVGMSPEQIFEAGGYESEIKKEIERGVRDADPVAVALSKRKVPIVRPFEFLSLGILAYVGGSKAIAQVDVTSSSTKDKDGTQQISLRGGGWAGWVLWRSVYLTKQVAFRNRVLVLFDWMKSQAFGRDIACL